MRTTNSPFIAHCVEGARRFIQTAVVIDNEAALGTLEMSQAQSHPKRAQRKSSSVLEESELKTSAAPADEVASIRATEPEGEASVPETDTQASHFLNAKALTDAFLAQSVICGLYKPDPGENMVMLSANAAVHCDVVIIDWYLEDRNSVKAKEIIRNILISDMKENGRLRLIAVYTSEPGLTLIAREVFDAIEQESNLKGRLALSDDEMSLNSSDTRICFFNKPNTIGKSDVVIVTESDLPERLVGEFAVLTEGVLATFAVTSIAAVRRTAHHIVALFRKELDGAYVAHRCALHNPEDAKEFATDLIGGELRNTVSMNEVADNCMSCDVLEKWIDHLVSSKGHNFTDHLVAEAPPEVVKDFIRNGEPAVEKSADQQHQRGKPGQRIGKNKKPINCESVCAIFYSDLQEGWYRMLDFARMTTFKRESIGRTRFPGNWRPSLTLGSVLKVLRSDDEREEDEKKIIYSDLSEDFLICVQPRCDSVRLKATTSFPFQTASVASERFNLVVKDGPDSGTPILVKIKPRDAVMIRFDPDNKTETVRAELLDDQKLFVFTDKLGRRFRWLADIKDLKAQRDASDLAAQLHRVGIDELEWLRRAATGKIKKPPA